MDSAQARMYAASLGRFYSGDPLMASADLINPQTFSRYNYVGNNPTSLTDPTGLIWGIKDGTIEWFDDEAAMHAKKVVAYAGLVAMQGGVLVALNPTANAAQQVPGGVEALKQLMTWGAGAAALEASAVTLLGAGLLTTAALAELYARDPTLPAPVGMGGDPAGASIADAIRQAFGLPEDPIIKHNNLWMANALKKNQDQSGINGESSPADPNSRKPKDVDNEPTEEGVPLKLTKDQISQSRTIARGNGIDDIRRLVKQYGGRASDWSKKSSPITDINGRPAEIHWYQNKAVGKVELKIKYVD